jgi:hypothetical protein
MSILYGVILLISVVLFSGVNTSPFWYSLIIHYCCLCVYCFLLRGVVVLHVFGLSCGYGGDCCVVD